MERSSHIIEGKGEVLVYGEADKKKEEREKNNDIEENIGENLDKMKYINVTDQSKGTQQNEVNNNQKEENIKENIEEIKYTNTTDKEKKIDTKIETINSLPEVRSLKRLSTHKNIISLLEVIL